ncbi:MAG: folate-binding protein YgfZ [Pseudomonadota bacterium]|nr:MAG: folate-binding protein YgfZ [Pseudomonadota bacterium]
MNLPVGDAASSPEPVLVVPELDRATIVARGSEAVSWLNGLVTCDITGLSSGCGAYGLLLNKQGKIQADLDVVATREGLVIGVPEARADAVYATLDAHLVMEDVELELAPELAWIRLHGGRAPELAARLAAEAVVAHGTIDWLGLGGAALVVRRGALENVVASLLDGGNSARQLDSEEWERLRLTAGFPRFGVDYGPEDNPHEASLERRAVSFQKGCYLGQEVVCMQDMRGRVKRRLLVLRLAAGTAPAPGTPVTSPAAAEPVGRVTSRVALPQGGALAFARVKAPYFEGGAALTIEGQGAEIVSLSGPAEVLASLFR